MQIIHAPEDYTALWDEVPCFMAGGIQKCNWQDAFLLELEQHSLPNLVVYNPLRSSFDVSNPHLATEQIAWEFKYLNKYLQNPRWIFSMYFDASESPQPICFYELGRYLALLDAQRSHVYNAIVSINPKFSRLQDVQIQSILATEARTVPAIRTPKEHAIAVVRAYRKIMDENYGGDIKC